MAVADVLLGDLAAVDDHGEDVRDDEDADTPRMHILVVMAIGGPRMERCPGDSRQDGQAAA